MLARVYTPDLREDVGQLLCVGFAGTSLSDDTARLLAAHHIGSVVLFRRNITSGAQVAALTASLRGLKPTGSPLVVAVDQEGGAVARLRGITTDFPPMATLGATDDEGLAHAYGTSLGEELGALGINLDFAPVVDVNTNPLNPVIGNRALSSSPDRVARLAAAQIKGMTAAGLLSCAKHFPGHGDTLTDSHKELPVLPHDLNRLRAVELPPFAAAIAAGVPAIMTAHVRFPALDSDRPATLSPAVIGGLLRTELGFDGVVATDDLEMAAIAEEPGVVQACLMALEAGADLMLICHSPALQIAAWEALLRAGERDSEVRRRIKQSAHRVRHMASLSDTEAAVPAEELDSWLRGGHAQALALEMLRRGTAALEREGLVARAPDATSAPGQGER